MSQDRTRKIVVTGVMGAISVLLGVTHWGFIPWFSGASLTIMHVPVIIGAILEGPWVGAIIGLIFGLFSILQAAIAPSGPTDVWFTNPLLAVLPRLFIGPIAWLVWKSLTTLERRRFDCLRDCGQPDQHHSGIRNDCRPGIRTSRGRSARRSDQWIP